MIYTPILDKVRFTYKCKRGVDDFLTIERILAKKGYSKPKDVVYNVNANKFFYNTWYVKDESTVFIGQGFNSFGGSRDLNTGVLEINPQKTSFFLTKELLTVAKPKDVKRFDVACDYQNRTFADLVYQTRADVMTYGTLANYTLYIGPKSRSGRVKIYRKDLERKADSQVPIMRVEMSINNICADYVAHAERLSNIGFLISTPENMLLAHVSEDIRRAYIASVSRPTRLKALKQLSFEADMINIDAFELHTRCEKLLLPYCERGISAYG